MTRVISFFGDAGQAAAGDAEDAAVDLGGAMPVDPGAAIGRIFQVEAHHHVIGAAHDIALAHVAGFFRRLVIPQRDFSRGDAVHLCRCRSST